MPVPVSHIRSRTMTALQLALRLQTLYRAPDSRYGNRILRRQFLFCRNPLANSLA